MNYIEIDFNSVKGYNKLSDAAKDIFERTYKRHNAGWGMDYKEDWIPVSVKCEGNSLKVVFKNGEWLRYYSNGTWG